MWTKTNLFVNKDVKLNIQNKLLTSIVVGLVVNQSLQSQLKNFKENSQIMQEINPQQTTQ